MRDFSDLARRARHAAIDLKFLFFPPSARLHDETSPLAAFPDPRSVAATLRHTPYAAEVMRLADAALANRLLLFEHEIDPGTPINWRRDPISGKSSEPAYFPIKKLDFDRFGESRIVWALNRHQHLVLLAQAALLSDRDEYCRPIPEQITNWAESNRFPRGINWFSPYEVGMRCLNWIWLFHLAGFTWDTTFRERFLNLLYQHGAYLDHNCAALGLTPVERLGASVALYALGRLFPKTNTAKNWRRSAIGFIRHALNRVLADGAWCEQSSYLHLTALDLFLFFYLVSNRPPQIRHKLERMVDYLRVLQGPSRKLPFIGDDDGGRLFHPYGPREGFARATLATCSSLFDRHHDDLTADDAAEQAAWWLGTHALESRPPAPESIPRSHLFKTSGLAVICGEDRQVLIDAATFGPSRGRHSHADTLSIIVRTKRDDILIDPGTYTFHSDPSARDWFRGTAAHNTVRIDGLDQATALPGFGWKSRPVVQVVSWVNDPGHTSFEATCHARGISHRRRIRYYPPDYLFIVDFVEGRQRVHYAEQFWHPGDGNEWRVLIPAGVTIHREQAWRSAGFSQRQAATMLRVRKEGDLPLVMPALILLNDTQADSLELRHTAKRICGLFANGEPLLEFEI